MALTDVFKIGAEGTEGLTNILHLWGFVNTTGNVSHLRKNFTTAGYQVTAGKTLYMVRMHAMMHTAGALTGTAKIGYADNDVGFDTATARTNAVMAIGVDDTVDNGVALGPSHVASNNFNPHFDPQSESFTWPIAAASKFPFVRYKGTTGAPLVLMVWCIEL